MRRFALFLLVTAAAAEGDLEREIGEFVADINREKAAGAVAPMAKRIDIDAFVEEMGGQDLPTHGIGEILRRRPDLLRKVDEQLGTETVRLRKVRPTPGGAVAVVDLRDEDGAVSRIRLFLVKLRGEWRISDFDAPELGMRFSTLLGVGMQAFTTDPKAPSAFLAFVPAMQAFQGQDFARARGLLERTPPLPGKLEAVRLVCLAACLLAGLEHEQALKACEEAEKKHGDMPIVFYLRAACLQALDRPEEALAACRTYVEIVGETPDICSMMGSALESLDRPAEAAEAYRAGLREDPASEDNLVSLVCCLPARKKGEVVEHFKRMPDPSASFGSVASAFWEPEDLPALRALIAAYAEISPEDPWIDYYAAEALGIEGKPLEAAARLKAALARVGEEDRVTFLDSYYGFTVEGGRALEAYDEATDRAEAFRSLAVLLDDTDALAALVERRGKDGEPDEDLRDWRIELAWRQGRHEDVVRLAAEIVAADESGWLDDRRVRSLIRTGRSKEALVEAKRSGGPYLLLLAHVALGNGPEAIAAFESCIEAGYDAQEMYDDEDLAALGKADAFAPLRAKHAPPEEDE